MAQDTDMPRKKPPIDISQNRYDLKTYSGRLRHFFDVTDPRTLLASRQQLKDAQQLVNDYASGNRPDLYGKEAEVWQAKKLVESSIHPDTGEPVLLPFRMAAFVPTNLVIVAGMLMPNASTFSTIFWQVANQTLNVCVNYSNASAGATMTSQEIALAYLSATTTSVGLAVGLNKLVPRLKSLSPAAKTLAGRFVPFVAVASAGCVNVGLMRWKEIREGTDIYPPSTAENPKPASLGKSTEAGRLAVAQTAASRILTNIPTLILPPLAMTMLQKRGAFRGPRGKAVESVTNLGLVGAALYFFLPPAIAAFPQRASLSVSHLEGFQSIKDPLTGNTLDYVEFNKGL